jgi:hypothetical protein
MKIPFAWRYWVQERREAFCWWLAYQVPRKVALLVFVRVCSATQLAPDEITYEGAYKAFEGGAGR